MTDATSRALDGTASRAAPSALTAVGIGLATARGRLLRRPTLLMAALGVALVVAGAIIEEHAGSAGAVDRTLLGTFRLVIPLVAFVVSVEAAARGNLRDSTWPLARYGLARRDVALGLSLAALAVSAVLGALYAALSVVLTPSAVAPVLAHDVLQSAWIGALTAAAYGGWFALGSTFLPRGRGRWVPLLADYAVAGSSSIFAAVLPGGNAQNLLGGVSPMHLTQASSSAILAVSAAALVAVASLRCRE